MLPPFGGMNGPIQQIFEVQNTSLVPNCLKNANVMPIPYTGDMTNKQTIPELLAFCLNQSENCLHLSIIIYLEIHVLITYRNLPFNTILRKKIIFLLSRPSNQKYISFFSRPFSSPVIRVSL